LFATFGRGRARRYNRYTDAKMTYSVEAMLRESLRFRRNALGFPKDWFISKAPAEPFMFFGLHFQPESSIDVCAHFYSNQVRVVELMSRSIPPTHKLLVKLHKSASAHYSRSQLAEFAQLPGVQLVSPYANTRDMIQKASVVFSIQGTIGLEAALLGKPVVMFADSPTKVFPNVSIVGRPTELPDLIRAKLAEQPPSRAQTIEAYMDFLAPFCRASLNDWTIRPTDAQIDGYVELFDLLAAHQDQPQWVSAAAKA
jgi:CDP-glycerol glycerophosphotransferase (TagB/SpsB family)